MNFKTIEGRGFISQSQKEGLPKIKSVKFISSDISKHLYSKDVGSMLKTMKIKNNDMKTQIFKESVEPIPITEHIEGFSPVIKEKHMRNFSNDLKSSFDKFSSKNASTHFMLDQTTNTVGTNLKLKNNFSMPKFDLSKKSKISSLKIASSKDLNFSLYTDRKSQKDKMRFYCPNCTHCNEMYESDTFLEKQIVDTREAQYTLKKGISFVTDLSNNDKINLDEFFSLQSGKGQDKFQVEEFIGEYTKNINPRNFYLQTGNFLQALLDDKLNLENFVGHLKVDKLNNSLLYEGKTFNVVDSNLIEFEKETDLFLEENIKNNIKKVFKKFKEDEFSQNKKNKFTILFISLIHSLSEIFSDCKEKAILIYKIFKLYFVEIEKKWIAHSNQLKEKISFYKELCKNILQTKTTNLIKLDDIMKVLSRKKVTQSNLDDHKKMIQVLIQSINEKRDEIFLLKNEKEILEGELNLWLYDYDKLKINKPIRDKMQEINSNINLLVTNVRDEMGNKQVSAEERILLVNADLYSIASGHRNYFYEEKAHLLSEITRLTKLYEKHYFKKRQLKNTFNLAKEEHKRDLFALEKDLAFLREKLSWERKDNSCQTEVDYNLFNKMKKNNDVLINQKRMIRNKLTSFLENIQYDNCKEKPLPFKSLLFLIPELYNEKLELDNICDIKDTNKITMDEFFYNYMSEKFKLSKLIRKNCEQTILAILRYSNDDSRVDLLRRFLGIGENKLRKEVLEVYLLLFKNLPISFYRMFESDYKCYRMNLDVCLEIYFNKLSHLELLPVTRDILFNRTIILDGEKEIFDVNYEKKYEYFLLSRMHSRSFTYLNSIASDLKLHSASEGDIKIFLEHFRSANKDFDFISDNVVIQILEKNFLLSKNKRKINIDALLNFFVKKFNFKIKVSDFLEITLDAVVSTYIVLEKYLEKLYNEYNKTDIISYKEFENLICRILQGKLENKWKVTDYFSKAVQSPDKDYLTKGEFITFCLNTKDVLYATIKISKGL